jgi:Flp pilus assembly protein TadB
MLFSFFKQHRNKSYNYTPRYYDERKERLENLKKKHGLIKDESQHKGYRRQSFRDDWKKNNNIQSNKNSRIRLLVILVFLLLAAYVALTYLDIQII